MVSPMARPRKGISELMDGMTVQGVDKRYRLDAKDGSAGVNCDITDVARRSMTSTRLTDPETQCLG